MFVLNLFGVFVLMFSAGKGENTDSGNSAALEGPLLKFHEACEGDLEAVAELFHAMSGQALPPPVLCQIMNVPPEIVQAASRENPIKVSSAQLLGGVAAALDEGDSAAMYFDKIEACAARVSERKEIKKLRFTITLDESTALDMESRLLNNMKNDTMMLEHLAGIKDLHDKWRENSDVEDASRFPTIVVGPQVLSFEGMSAAHHDKLLNPTEREQFFLRPGEGCVGLLREKLAPLRRSNPSVGQAQRQRVAWLVTQATGVVVSEEALGNIEGIAALDSKLAAEVSSEVFQKTIDDLLGDVKLGPSSVRIDAVETEISKAIGRAASSMPVPIRGYDAVVLHASLRAITEENYVGDFSPTDPPPIAASLTAVKKTRRKIGDRFFRKKWLPLESNPDIFNQLGAQLGLPTSEVEFYEVFGMDAEVLSLLALLVQKVQILTQLRAAACHAARAVICAPRLFPSHTSVPQSRRRGCNVGRSCSWALLHASNHPERVRHCGADTRLRQPPQ